MFIKENDRFYQTDGEYICSDDLIYWNANTKTQTFSASKQSSNELTAFKIRERRNEGDKLLEYQILQDIHGQKSCPNLIKPIGKFENARYVGMQLPYYTGADLLSLLEGPTDKLKELQKPKKLNKFVKCIFKGLYRIHRKGYLVLDIKAANILCCTKSKYKIIDLASAQPIFGSNKSLVAKLNNHRNKITEQNTEGRTDANQTTPEFCAPEQEFGQAEELGYYTDYYSLCLMIWWIVKGRRPPSVKERKEGIFILHRDPMEKLAVGVDSNNPLFQFVDKNLSLDFKVRTNDYEDLLDVLGEFEKYTSTERIHKESRAGFLNDLNVEWKNLGPISKGLFVPASFVTLYSFADTSLLPKIKEIIEMLSNKQLVEQKIEQYRDSKERLEYIDEQQELLGEDKESKTDKETDRKINNKI